jgi:hypothetical protein
MTDKRFSENLWAKIDAQGDTPTRRWRGAAGCAAQDQLVCADCGALVADKITWCSFADQAIRIG